MKDKILILSPRLPYPVIGGDKLRIYNICKFLCNAGYRLTLLSFVEKREEVKLALTLPEKDIFEKVKVLILPKMRSFLNCTFGLISKKALSTWYYKSSIMKKLVKRELSSGSYKAVIVHLIRMAPYVTEYKNSNTLKILEMTDAISLNYSRCRWYGNKRSFKYFSYTLEVPRLKRFEVDCIHRFNRVVVVSSIDKDYLLKQLDRDRARIEGRIYIIPNGVDADDSLYVAKNYDPDLIVFIGNMRSYQNDDAVLYFINDIFPLIKKKIPKARLKVVGAKPSRKLRKLHGMNGIEITGKVKEVASYVKDACVSVAPIRIGAGIQNKILESMALGIPVVSSSMGLEGIKANPNEHLLVANSPKDFCDAVLKIMEDKELRTKLAIAGRTLVEQNYQWNSCLKPYLDLIEA